jgi:hypothetical protein
VSSLIKKIFQDIDVEIVVCYIWILNRKLCFLFFF